MTSVNELNAVTNEKARVRDAVLKLDTLLHFEDEKYVKRSEVLAIISENYAKNDLVSAEK